MEEKTGEVFPFAYFRYGISIMAISQSSMRMEIRLGILVQTKVGFLLLPAIPCCPELHWEAQQDCL